MSRDQFGYPNNALPESPPEQEAEISDNCEDCGLLEADGCTPYGKRLCDDCAKLHYSAEILVFVNHLANGDATETSLAIDDCTIRADEFGAFDRIEFDIFEETKSVTFDGLELMRDERIKGGVNNGKINTRMA